MYFFFRKSLVTIRILFYKVMGTMLNRHSFSAPFKRFIK